MWPKNLECWADLQCGKSIMAMLEFKYVPDVADHMITEEGLDTLENWGGELGRAGHHCQRWGRSGWNSKIDEWKECSELHPRWIASFEISPLIYLVSFQFSSSHISIMTYFYHSDAFIAVDLNEITMNLVPFPRLHYLVSSMSPYSGLSFSGASSPHFRKKSLLTTLVLFFNETWKQGLHVFCAHMH